MGDKSAGEIFEQFVGDEAFKNVVPDKTGAVLEESRFEYEGYALMRQRGPPLCLRQSRASLNVTGFQLMLGKRRRR